MKKDAAVRLMRLGKPVECPICGGNEFRSRNALLNTRGLTFFNLDWANQKATLQVCERCGNVLWFLEEGSRMENSSRSTDAPAIP